MTLEQISVAKSTSILPIHEQSLKEKFKVEQADSPLKKKKSAAGMRRLKYECQNQANLQETNASSNKKVKNTLVYHSDRELLQKANLNYSDKLNPWGDNKLFDPWNNNKVSDCLWRLKDGEGLRAYYENTNYFLWRPKLRTQFYKQLRDDYALVEKTALYGSPLYELGRRGRVVFEKVLRKKITKRAEINKLFDELYMESFVKLVPKANSKDPKKYIEKTWNNLSEECREKIIFELFVSECNPFVARDHYPALLCSQVEVKEFRLEGLKYNQFSDCHYLKFTYEYYKKDGSVGCGCLCSYDKMFQEFC
jgi:hypothetical protein